ncbi:zinc finger protein [Macleaya cordata]|uniref:Zinc finger protein n=1 Tax=Macleaya cordata TaxID=56857 RepID=A0A200QQP1_MACCD|nr:zinc finger protein [Macleaya cordata]
MLKESRSSRGGGNGGGGGWARLCDSCRSAACAVYCQADSAYLCTNCDARVHAANHVASRHERVWVCEACENAPAAFTCKADAAALCTSCDAEIHSANPLARRHHRVPILPIHGCLYGTSSATHFSNPFGSEPNLENGLFDPEMAEEVEEEDEDETASWLLLNPLKNNPNANDNNNNNNNNNSNNQSVNNGYLFGGEVDEYLDLVDYNNNDHQNQYLDHHYNQQMQHQQNNFDEKKMKNDRMSDSVVPMQHQHQQNNLQLEMDYETIKAGFGYTTSIIHTVSMDTSIVPDSTTNDISNSHSRPSKGTIDLFSSPPIQMPPQFSPMDREARVLRYREKRKTRKFEKTIRYASRKAYAETRPRIKGRFAKRTDAEVEVDQMFSNTVIAESGYSIVPSF